MICHHFMSACVAGGLIFQAASLYAQGLGDDAPGKETLAHALAANAVRRANGLTGSTDDTRELANWSYGIYSTTNLHLLTNATWSTTCWLHGVRGLSATAIGYSNGMGGQTLLTMVSPRHYLFASHTHPEVSLVAFLDTNNVIY